jgi:hypothetical protein
VRHRPGTRDTRPRPLAGVNDAISEVLLGKAKARLVLEP